MRTAAAALALLATAGLLVIAETPAQAAGKLTVSKTRNLSRAGETVTVSGRGYDVDKGIYVAFCVDNGPGVLPSPCGGGADMSGGSGSSAWISSNPPSYGEGLAMPYGKGGTFRVSLKVSRKIGDVDCTQRGCAVVTRADHTRTSDRSQDVRVPIRFAPDPAGGTAAPAVTAQAGRTTAPTTKTAPATKQGTPAGPPTGRLATAAPPAATAAVAMESRQIPLTRTSSATPLGHWWAIAGAFTVGLLAATVVGRLRRRRATARDSS